MDVGVPTILQRLALWWPDLEVPRRDVGLPDSLAALRKKSAIAKPLEPTIGALTAALG